MDIEVFNASQDEIADRYNVFIGISMGALKPLNEELASDYISWALNHSKDDVAILIADEIGRINYEVFSNYSPGKARNRALRYGREYKEFFKETLEENFSDEQRHAVDILHWEDIWTDRKERMKEALDERYDSNKAFRNKVQSFVKAYVESRDDSVTDEELDFLSEYILYELPTLVDGVSNGETHFDLLLYPTYTHSGMSEFATSIQNGERLPGLNDRFDLRDTVLVETYFPD